MKFTLPLLAALFLSPLAALNASDVGAKPNVIVILVDDAGYGDWTPSSASQVCAITRS